MLNRRGTLRALLTGLTAVLALVGLTGCRSDPNVAAYVGDTTISVDRLQAAVAARKDADPAIAAYAQQHPVEFTRQVLDLLVTQQVYRAAAQRYSVQVRDDEVRQRIAQLIGSDDPASVYGQLAARGISQQDVVENVRQQLIRQRIAEAKGLAAPLSESALRARYDQIRGSLGAKSFGYITVPDQATADAVLKQLTANPGSYPQIAAAHPGQYTLPSLQPHPLDQLPPSLAQQIRSAAPNTGFTVPVPQAGGVVVVFVGDVVHPSFEQVRGQLEQEAQNTVGQAAQKLVDQVRDSLHVKVNPRYGVLENGSIQPATGGVVDILGSGDALGSGAGAAAGGTGSGAAGG